MADNFVGIVDIGSDLDKLDSTDNKTDYGGQKYWLVLCKEHDTWKGHDDNLQNPLKIRKPVWNTEIRINFVFSSPTLVLVSIDDKVHPLFGNQERCCLSVGVGCPGNYGCVDNPQSIDTFYPQMIINNLPQGTGSHAVIK